MSTSPVMTVTDELLAELEEITSRQPGANLVVRSSSMNLIYSELRRLRAENAELAKDAKRYQWLRDAGELTSDQFGAINEWLCGDGDFTYIARAIDTAMQADQ